MQPRGGTRQVIAYARERDVVFALSSSGNSANVIAECLADDVFVTRSEHIPRIEEAQAKAHHTLLELR